MASPTPVNRPLLIPPDRRRRPQPARPIQPGRLGPARRRRSTGWWSDGRPRTEGEQLVRVLLYGSVACATTTASTTFVSLAMRAGVPWLGVVTVGASVPAAGLAWAYGMARFRPVRAPAGLLPRPEPEPLADPNPSPVTAWWWITPHPGTHQESQRVTQSSRWWW